MHNNCLSQMAQFATNANWGRAVLEGSEIPILALTAYKQLHSIAINNWCKFSTAATLGHYFAPPMTWVSPKSAKETPKKSAKTSESSSPGSANKQGQVLHQPYRILQPKQ
jgi:hypothetical protein